MTSEDQSPRTILTIDSTLRDGEQGAGIYFTVAEKVKLAKALDAAGTSILDAGFPVVSKEEAEAFRAVAEAGLKAGVFATVRPDSSEIQNAHDLGADGVFLFFPISKILSGLIRSVTLEQFQAKIIETVRFAHKLGLEVIVVFEDAGRAGDGTEAETIFRLQPEGVESFMIAESVGALTPWGMQGKIASLCQSFPDIKFGIHCHDDYGLATANSLAAIEAGAVYFSGTVNGIGERAGNAPLEEAIVAIRNLLHLKTDIEPHKLYELCRTVEEVSGVIIPPNKAVSGANTFKCESGLHSRALLRQKSSYEPFPSESVGQSHSLVLGKHTGMEHLEYMLKTRNIDLSPEKKKELLTKIKSYQETNKGDLRRTFVEKCRVFYEEHTGLSDSVVEELLREVQGGKDLN